MPPQPSIAVPPCERVAPRRGAAPCPCLDCRTTDGAKARRRGSRPFRRIGGAATVRGQSGFTLIEIVVAFSILAVGLGIAMQIATGAMRQSRSAADYTEAALYAQSLLDNVGVGERLEESEDSGEFDERFSWSLRSEPYEIQTDSPLEPGIAPVELYRLELVVRWQRGRGEQEARFVTLRALTPDL